jgi:hypothetical protein
MYINFVSMRASSSGCIIGSSFDVSLPIPLAVKHWKPPTSQDDIIPGNVFNSSYRTLFDVACTGDGQGLEELFPRPIHIHQANGVVRDYPRQERHRSPP